MIIRLQDILKKNADKEIVDWFIEAYGDVASFEWTPESQRVFLLGQGRRYIAWLWHNGLLPIFPMHGFSFLRQDLSHGQFTHMYMASCNFGEADLTAAEMTGSDLSFASFIMVSARGILMPGANMAHVSAQGADFLMANMAQIKASSANLTHAMLSGADLTYADLSSAILTKADLRDANLESANLVGANLVGADLSGAILSGVTLTKASLGKVIYDEETTWPKGFDIEAELAQPAE